jgi:hypothetical protein
LRTDSAENVVWVGIVVLARTRKNVLLRTLDVRQIRRTVSGDEEGTRNEEHLLRSVYGSRGVVKVT